jgi:hypothetical protein
MAAQRKSQPLPALTPRAREVVTAAINAVALGTHDDQAEIGALAAQLKTTPGRLQPILRKLQSQGWLTVNHDFIYPTVAALQWQNPQLNHREASHILKRLR